MSVGHLSILALRTVLGGTCKVVGGDAGEGLANGVARFLASRLNDPSQAAVGALKRSTDRAWRAIEVALAGESLLGRLDRAEDRAFRDQLRAFLTAVAAEVPAHDEAFRRRCLADLRAARRDGVLLSGQLGDKTAQATASFLKFTDQTAALKVEWDLLARLAEQIHKVGYADLAELVRLRVGDGTSLLALAVRFFFRQETAADPMLFHGLMAEQIDQLSRRQDQAMRELGDALEKQGHRLESLLESIQAVVIQTHGAVLDVQAELQRQSEQSRQQFDALYQAVLALQARLDLANRELKPRDSLSIRSDNERQAVRQLASRYRSLPAEQRESLPALLNAIGKLEVAAGDFDAAREDFGAVARLVGGSAGGEAHFNAYLTALEQGRLDDALQQYLQAVKRDERFALFSLAKYEPKRILGAGGFGVTFHCRYRNTGGDVAVKSITPDGLERDVATVFQEAGTLDSLHHAAIVRLRECDFADAEKRRPYLVMEYFDGLTLEAFVRERGELPAAQFLAVFAPVAEALAAAHARGVFHRDVKPANLLVRPPQARGEEAWQVKVIDFGLALKQSVLADVGASSRGRSVLGGSIAGTIDYAAPEQLGKLPGVRIGPAADVYGFGRTACFALFRTPNPLRAHWKQVPDALADLLEACLHEDPSKRLAGFDAVLARMKALARPAAPPRPVAQPVMDALPVEAIPVAQVDRPPPRREVRPAEPPPPRRFVEPEVERPRRVAPPKKPDNVWRLPRLLSAVLAVVYLATTFGIGYMSDPKYGGKRLTSGQVGDAIGTTVVLVLCAAVFGAPCGLIIRSVRGWLFVLAVSLVMATLMALFPTSTKQGVRASPVGDFFAMAAVWAFVAWVIALPIKLVFFLVKRAQQPG